MSTAKPEQPEFPYSFDLKGEQINFRKWKGKDRKAFLKLLKQDDIDENAAANTLVYSCLEKQIALSTEEFRYVIAQIRKVSISSTVKYNFLCQECDEEYSTDIKLDDIVKQKYSDNTLISTDDTKIKLTDVRNREFYNKKIEEQYSDDEIYLCDFLLRIESLNEKDDYTYDELVEYFDDLDTDELDKIFDQWDDIRFVVEDVHTVTCPNCKTPDTYKFDEIEGFFPSTWIIRI